MKNRFFLIVVTVVAAIVMTSCGKVPQASIDAASAAIDSAKAVQADVYLPVEFTALNDSMTVITQGIETQKSKLFKNYKDVQAQADAVTAAATQMVADAAAKKEEVKGEAEALLAKVSTLLEEDLALVKKAPTGKEGKAVLDEIKSEIGVIEASIGEAKTIFDGGANYMEVLNKSKAAEESLTAIKTELEEAIAKARK